MTTYKPSTKTESQTRYSISELKEEISRLFEGTTLDVKRVIQVKVSPPEVCKSPKECKAKKLELRNSIQIITSKTVELKQFDPNFFSRDGNICCRFPGCKQRREKKGNVKADLYLCPSHRNKLEASIEKMCARKGVDIDAKNWSSEDLKEYTSLIGLLESAYRALAKPTAPWSGLKRRNAVLGNVFLNMRNYLIIVNALLNPDDENLITALIAPLSLFKEMLQYFIYNYQETLKSLKQHVKHLNQVMELNLFAFGIIYNWVELESLMSAGAQIGVGIGGALGLIGMAAGPAVGAITTIGGAIFGGFLGDHVYSLGKSDRDREADNERFHAFHAYQQFAQEIIRAQGEEVQPGAEEEHAVYYITGNASGDTYLGSFREPW